MTTAGISNLSRTKMISVASPRVFRRSHLILLYFITLFAIAFLYIMMTILLPIWYLNFSPLSTRAYPDQHPTRFELRRHLHQFFNLISLSLLFLTCPFWKKKRNLLFFFLLFPSFLFSGSCLKQGAIDFHSWATLSSRDISRDNSYIPRTHRFLLFCCGTISAYQNSRVRKKLRWRAWSACFLFSPAAAADRVTEIFLLPFIATSLIQDPVTNWA